MQNLDISIVTYAPSLPLLEKTLQSLTNAMIFAHKHGFLQYGKVFVIDNGPDLNMGKFIEKFAHVFSSLSFVEFKFISGHGNIGFGRGHNLAIREGRSNFHLILNPDVNLCDTAIKEAMSFMSEHDNVGLLSPYTANGHGGQQYTCKRYPTLLNLSLRGFAPEIIKKVFTTKLAFYEMHDVCKKSRPVFDIPIVSGCFMFCRRKYLNMTGGFLNNFFLYFEDFDLSLRMSKVAQIAYVPKVKIVHYGGHVSSKELKHIFLFIRSGYTFFQTHGWKLW